MSEAWCAHGKGMVEPRVTIGLPTYNRPQLLRRALASVASQTYSALEVIVSDNASSDQRVAAVVKEFRVQIPGIRYVRQRDNIGALGNFAFLLEQASGTYFMWLADDDEISPDYVSSLVALLAQQPDAVAAAGHWILMENVNTGRPMPTASFPQHSALRRAAGYIWSTDDAFFYALHRTDVLRQASFTGYLWPNRGVLLNWAYVYLLDVVLRGRVLLAVNPSARFINHDYTEKDYQRSERALVAGVRHLCRRLNVHLLYLQKCARMLGPAVLPLLILVSIGALVREGSTGVVRRLWRMRGTERRGGVTNDYAVDARRTP
jgi:glycosyltransferase involved in cell wall biosynthesis